VEALTSSLKRLAASPMRLVARPLDELEHSIHRTLIPPIHSHQDPLQRHVLVQRRVSILGTARSSKPKELRDSKEALPQLPLRASLARLPDLPQGLRLVLLKRRREVLLEALLLRLQTGLVVGVDLPELAELLLELGELGLQGGLLQDLGLLVGVDDAGGDELVEGLFRVLAEKGVGFGSVELLKC
jgi:hypothetical protein